METGHGSHSPSASGQSCWRFNFPATSVYFTKGGATRIIVFSLWTFLIVLSGCANQTTVGNTPLRTTPSPIGADMRPITHSAQTTRTSGGVTATVLIQGKRMGFASDCGCGDNGSGIIIDSSRWVRIATDGTGEVAGYLKPFDFTPPTAQVPLSSGLPAASMTNGSQTIYYVPSACMTEYDTARSTSFEELRSKIQAYQKSTGNNALPMLGLPPLLDYPATFDFDHIACSPAAGYQQSTPFYYMISVPAHVTVPFFNVSDVMAFRKQQALAHIPVNFEFEEIGSTCGMPYAQKVSATTIEYRCDAGGYYRWQWTSAIARSLAAHIAGKDLATARNILAAYPGADIYQWQGISFQIVGGSSLPSDPSQIRFKVYDTVVVGTSGVQTTGTPQIVP